MKFDTKNLFLKSDLARALFEKVAGLPIIDYHNHLDASAIAADAPVNSAAKLWVVSDPYKHRAMRLNGVCEREISGGASDSEKFAAWARTLPKTWGNPLFHWSMMETERFFGCDEVLCPENADELMRRFDAHLAAEKTTVNSVLRSMNVETLCTSDDLLADVSVHKAATAKAGTFAVLPSLRADSVFSFGLPTFKDWFAKLQKFGTAKNLDDYLGVLKLRLDAFSDASCRLADHSLDNGFAYVSASKDAAAKAFAAVLDGTADGGDIVLLKSYLLRELAVEYSRRGWVLQLHIGAERYTSSRLRALAGAAGGYASIGRTCDISSLARFLDDVDMGGGLPKTVLYTLNPADNCAFATLSGSFSRDGVAPLLQFGPAWWYNDHLDGIRAQMRSLAAYGLLANFVGMTTDSRSILSFSRHEYFRRILCEFLASAAERGEIPSDFDFLSKAASDISYFNSKNWIF